MIQFKTTLLLLVVALTCLCESAFASHPFHVTRAEIEYNAKRKKFEVAICVWPEDLAKAVSKMEDRTINIDTETETNRDKVFHKYVAQKFKFISQSNNDSEKSAAATIRWIGSELEVKQGWLYFEVEAKAAATSWSIENRMFFELNDDQLNQVQVRNGKLMESQTLSGQQPSVGWTRE